MIRQRVMHVYFGNAQAHPIIMNYVRCQAARRHDILLKKPFRNKVFRLAQLFWKLGELRFTQPMVIVHAHDVVSATLAVSLLFKNVIFDSHEIYESLPASTSVAKMVAAMERYATRRARLVIYPSKQRLNYSTRGAKPNAVVIENLFLPERRRLSDEERHLLERLCSQVRASPGRRFVYAGTFSAVRGISELLDVFSDQRLAGDSLFIAGRPSSQVERLLERAPKSVQFIGELPHDVMIELLPSFDAGIALYKPINANNRLAAPTKLFEFIYFGLAVITNRSEYIEEVVRKLDIDNVHMAESVTCSDILVACAAVSERHASVAESTRKAVSWLSQLPRIEAMYKSIEEDRLTRDKELLS